MTLEKLQEVGSLPTSLKRILKNSYPFCTLSEALSDNYKESVVICDDCDWVATVGGKPIQLSKVIYSGNENNVCVWHSDTHKLSLLEPIDRKLSVVKQINFKRKMEDQKMADVSLEKMDISMADLGNLDLNPAAVEGAANTTVTETAKPKSEAAARIGKIKSIVGASSKTVASRNDLVMFNQKYGRAMGFVCRTDAAVKVSRKKQPKLDGNGQYIFKPTCSAEDKQKIIEGKKAPTSTFVEVEINLAFKEAKPTKPIAMIIATPAGGDRSLAEVTESQVVQADKKDTTLVTKVLSMEQAFLYLAALYDGKISESDAILGDRATLLQVVYKASKAKEDSAAKFAVKPALTVSKIEGKRTTLLTRGNYIALRKYVTANAASASESEAEGLNLQLNALIKGVKEGDNVSPDVMSHIKMEQGKVVASDYFRAGGGDPTLLPLPATFDGVGTVSEMQLPVRVVKKDKAGDIKRNKQGDIVTGFEYVENTFEDATSKDFLAKAAVTKEALVKACASKPKASTKTAMSSDDFLTLFLSKDQDLSIDLGAMGKLDTNEVIKSLSSLDALA